MAFEIIKLTYLLTYSRSMSRDKETRAAPGVTEPLVLKAVLDVDIIVDTNQSSHIFYNTL